MSQLSTFKKSSTSKKTYLFYKKRNLAKRFFEKGLDAGLYVLLALGEGGKGFLESLPDCYPSFKLLKMTFGISGRGEYCQQKITPRKIRTNFYRLEKQGLVAKDPKEKVCYLTPEGKEIVAFLKNRYAVLNQPWDKKLRIVIFDIPEQKKYWRASIRRELLSLEYIQLQKSVYAGKHPLPESFLEEIEGAGLWRHIFIFTVDKVDRKDEILQLLDGSR